MVEEHVHLRRCDARETLILGAEMLGGGVFYTCPLHRGLPHIRRPPMSFSTPSLRIVEVLATSLPPALAERSARRYGGELPLHGTEMSEPSSAAIHFCLAPPELPSLDVRFTVRPLGGNVYEVQATIKEGPSQTFSYCLPEPAPLLVPNAPRFIHDAGTFLLDAIERHLGRILLRTKLRPKADASSRAPKRPTRAG